MACPDGLFEELEASAMQADPSGETPSSVSVSDLGSDFYFEPESLDTALANDCKFAVVRDFDGDRHLQIVAIARDISIEEVGQLVSTSGWASEASAPGITDFIAPGSGRSFTAYASITASPTSTYLDVVRRFIDDSDLVIVQAPNQ